jgi:hypothetical protein
MSVFVGNDTCLSLVLSLAPLPPGLDVRSAPYRRRNVA